MSRIKNLFERKPNRVLNVYCTAGYPGLNDTLPLLRALQTHGADLVELGMPYSDPLADGPVIQHSSSIALANGMTLRHLFGQLSGMRRPVSEGGIGDQLPVVLLGGAGGKLQGGRVLDYTGKPDRQLCRLFLSLMADGGVLEWAPATP